LFTGIPLLVVASVLVDWRLDGLKKMVPQQISSPLLMVSRFEKPCF
jgi:hypothetical protein